MKILQGILMGLGIFVVVAVIATTISAKTIRSYYKVVINCENLPSVEIKLEDVEKESYMLAIQIAKLGEDKGCTSYIMEVSKNSVDTIYTGLALPSFGQIHGHSHNPYEVCGSTIFLPKESSVMQAVYRSLE